MENLEELKIKKSTYESVLFEFWVRERESNFMQIYKDNPKFTIMEVGSGLGLQLCQDFARKNGGDAMVESTLGEGSTFSVLIPLKKDE